MNEMNEPYEDPLIDEVRRRRRELFAQFDFDLWKFGEAIQREQAKHPEKVVDLSKRARQQPRRSEPRP